MSGFFAFVVAIALALLSLIALIISVAWAIFGKHPYQKYIAYLIGSGACLIMSIIYAFFIEKSRALNDFLDMTAIFAAGLIIFISIIIAKILSNLFKS